MEYKIVRSKRKTLSVSVSGGEVTVKAPLDKPVEQIEAFLTKKSNWITKKLAEQNKRNDVLRDVLDGKSVMYHGEFCPVIVTPEVKRTAFKDKVLYLPEKCNDKAELFSAVAAWGKRIAKTELNTALHNLSERIGLKYTSFALTNAKTKWGSCDGKCNIMLNWRLIMLENEVVAYVIVHELAHTVHHDHSAAFWRTVQRFLPTYKNIRKRLKEYSVLTTMYR